MGYNNVVGFNVAFRKYFVTIDINSNNIQFQVLMLFIIARKHVWC